MSQDPPQKEPAEAQVEADKILPEYDFSQARPNKYAGRFTAGSTTVALDPTGQQHSRSASP